MLPRRCQNTLMPWLSAAEVVVLLEPEQRQMRSQVQRVQAMHQLQVAVQAVRAVPAREARPRLRQLQLERVLLLPLRLQKARMPARARQLQLLPLQLQWTLAVLCRPSTLALQLVQESRLVLCVTSMHRGSGRALAWCCLRLRLQVMQLRHPAQLEPLHQPLPTLRQ